MAFRPMIAAGPSIMVIAMLVMTTANARLLPFKPYKGHLKFFTPAL